MNYYIYFYFSWEFLGHLLKNMKKSCEEKRYKLLVCLLYIGYLYIGLQKKTNLFNMLIYTTEKYNVSKKKHHFKKDLYNFL